ncbi:MAG: protein of unknown function endonuclease, partial [Acidimicrobiales bacterium]|nr:protein of unknown function endonuclease [Acidimicrobiales bacterium]
ALAGLRVAQGTEWRRAGDSSPAQHLARVTGTSVAAASATLLTAERMRDQPRVRAAALAGALSPAQAGAVASAVAVDPAAEARLVTKAVSRVGSLGDLVTDCARTRAAASAADAEARRARIHAQRSLREFTDVEGGWNLVVRDNPEVGAAIMARLGSIADRLFAEARRAGRHEPRPAHLADALAELAADSGAPGVAATNKVLVRVDLPTLLREHPAPGETCEIVGYGPVAVSAVRDMIASGNPVLAAIATAGERVLGVAHVRRRPSAKQVSALEWLYPTCAAEGCHRVAWLEFDHRQDWADTHVTLVELMDRLCRPMHDRKTREGWALVEGSGKRPFVAPDDPRHPRHTAKANSPPRVA